jgi:hypothetical protein
MANGLLDILGSALGTTPPSYLEGLLGAQQTEDLRKRSIGSGLVNALVGYAAMPKNQNLGLGRILAGAAQAGMQGAQGVYDTATKDYMTSQQIAEMKRKQDLARSQQTAIEKAAAQFPEYADAIRANPELLKEIVGSQINMEVDYKDAGDRLVPVNKRTGAPIANLEVIPKVNTSDKLTNLIGIRDRLIAEDPNNPNIKFYQDAIVKESQRAPTPVTNINMPFETNYQKTLGTKVAEAQLGEYETANKAANNIQKIDMTLSQIQNSDATTGLGADVINNVNRFKAQFLADKKAGKKVADTQILDAFLGSDVFPQIGALGIGAKGLDTPAEREFLRQVMTGTINMDKNALLRMTQIRRDIEKRAIDKYNKGIQQGKYDKFFDATGYAKEKIDIPEAPNLSSGAGGFSIRRIK